MNQKSLKTLAGISSTEGLRDAIAELCAPFGGAKSITLASGKGTSRYLCLVTLNATSQHFDMMRSLGGFSVGVNVGLHIPVRNQAPSQKQNADAVNFSNATSTLSSLTLGGTFSPARQVDKN